MSRDQEGRKEPTVNNGNYEPYDPEWFSQEPALNRRFMG